MTHNPYPNRDHPVGTLEYGIIDGDVSSVRKVKPFCMLEYGEPELLYDIPRMLKDGHYVNIGHSRGGSAMLLAKGLADRGYKGPVSSIDIKLKKRAADRIKQHQLDDIIRLYRGPSSKVVEEFNNAELTFIFIDGDHSYEGVKRDFDLWSLLLRSGGWVAFHDTNQEFTHKVLRERLFGSTDWKELDNLHVNRIRMFEKL